MRARDPSRNRILLRILPLLAFGSLILLHLVRIRADSPLFISTPGEPGIFIDEGFKTLDARNLALFGRLHWTEHDEYESWIEGSPITVAVHFLLFKAFGVSLAVARLCSLFFSVCTLLILYLFLRKVYSHRTVLLILFLCSINTVFFFYSRVALFEPKVLFFLVCAFYFVQLTEKHVLYSVPLLLSLAAAYYCKETSVIFALVLVIYYVSVFRDGFLIGRLLRPKSLVLVAGCIAAGALFLEYNHSFLEAIRIKGMALQRPHRCLLTLLEPSFFKKVPLLASLCFLYIGHVMISIMEDRDYKRHELLLGMWVVIGLVVHALFAYHALRYYFVLVIPMCVLAVRCVDRLDDVAATLFSGKNVAVKAMVFVACLSVLAVFSGWSFVAALPSGGRVLDSMRGYRVPAALGVVGLSTALYFRAYRYREHVTSRVHLHSGLYAFILVGCILLAHGIPLFRWSVGARYELEEAFRRMDSLEDESIVAGLWAPQLCINTRKRAWYLHYGQHGANFWNVRLVRPDYLVIADSTDTEFFEKFKQVYPDLLGEEPAFRLSYAGETIRVYRLR